MTKKVAKATVGCLIGIKVVLRPINIETDLDSIYRWINDPEVNMFLKAIGPLTLSQERGFLEGIDKDPNNVLFAIETRKDRKFIGTMGFRINDRVSGVATTGSFIGEKDYWGKGYGTDAKMLVLHYAFHSLNLRRINSSTIAYNGRSARCLEKCGYKKEGLLREIFFRNGKYWDKFLFRIFRSEFEPLWEDYSKRLAEFEEAIS